MRFRITVRGDGIELRGYLDATEEELRDFARNAAPWMVVASPAEDDFDPFDDNYLAKRELHHFEVEQENERLRADHTESEKVLIDRVNELTDENAKLRRGR